MWVKFRYGRKAAPQDERRVNDARMKSDHGLTCFERREGKTQKEKEWWMRKDIGEEEKKKRGRGGTTALGLGSGAKGNGANCNSKRLLPKGPSVALKGIFGISRR
jgi:hypothetical protein